MTETTEQDTRLDDKRALILLTLQGRPSGVHVGNLGRAGIFATLGGDWTRDSIDVLLSGADEAAVDAALARCAAYLPPHVRSAVDPLAAAREAWAVEALAAVLPPLRRLAEHARAAWGDPPEARFADALRLACAELLTSVALPGSPEMADADAALADLRPTTNEESNHG